MASIEDLRESFPVVAEIADDRLMQSPWLHIGILRASLDDARLALSLDVIADSLREAETKAAAS